MLPASVCTHFQNESLPRYSNESIDVRIFSITSLTKSVNSMPCGNELRPKRVFR